MTLRDGSSAAAQWDAFLDPTIVPSNHLWYRWLPECRHGDKHVAAKQLLMSAPSAGTL
jgi:hypothetical protein